jgi:hypothetical protein
MRDFIPFKGRKLVQGAPHKVYWNLHKDVWSLVAQDGPDKGRVVGHVPQLGLHDVKFVVSQAGRARVIREEKKNVHAFAVGIPVSPWQIHSLAAGPLRQLSYNPYKAGHFVVRDTGAKIDAAGLVVFNDAGKAFADAE